MFFWCNVWKLNISKRTLGVNVSVKRCPYLVNEILLQGMGFSLRLRHLNEVPSAEVSACEPSISTPAILNRDFASAVSEALERNVAVIGIFLEFCV